MAHGIAKGGLEKICKRFLFAIFEGEISIWNFSDFVTVIDDVQIPYSKLRTQGSVAIARGNS